MKVYTYFKQVKGMQDFSPLLAVWKNAWTKCGFEPIVLTYEPVMHPHYSEVVATIRDLPSYNPKQYTDNDFLRWLAMDMIGGLHVDSDVLPTQAYLRQTQMDLVTMLQKDVCPCAVWWVKGFNYLDLLKNYVKSEPQMINGHPHYSDQGFFRWAKDSGTFDVLDVCGTYPTDMDYPMIHYPTNNLPVGVPKHTAILNALQVAEIMKV